MTDKPSKPEGGDLVRFPGGKRNYSWPPFEPGNQVGMRHGAFSPRQVDPLAQELVSMVLADPDCAHAHAPRWRPALFAWARAEAQVQLLSEYLATAAEEAGDGVGDLDADRVKSAYLLLHRAESRADRSRARLGLDPLSAARLGRDRAAGVASAASAAQVMAELARREADGRPEVCP